MRFEGNFYCDQILKAIWRAIFILKCNIHSKAQFFDMKRNIQSEMHFLIWYVNFDVKRNFRYISQVFVGWPWPLCSPLSYANLLRQVTHHCMVSHIPSYGWRFEPSDYITVHLLLLLIPFVPYEYLQIKLLFTLRINSFWECYICKLNVNIWERMRASKLQTLYSANILLVPDLKGCMFSVRNMYSRIYSFRIMCPKMTTISYSTKRYKYNCSLFWTLQFPNFPNKELDHIYSFLIFLKKYHQDHIIKITSFIIKHRWVKKK